MIDTLLEKIKSKISRENKIKINVFLCRINNFFCDFFPMRDEIILESYPDLACNTYELYRYMIEKEVHERHHIIWLVNEPEKYKDYSIENIEFIRFYPQNKRERRKLYIRCNRARMIITCNRHVMKRKVSKKQINVYIEHGSPLKEVKWVFTGFSCGYMIIQSSFFTESSLYLYGKGIESIVPLGFPRNDQLFREYDSINKIYKDVKKFTKILIWVPTFRKHFSHKRVDCDSNFPFGIPILYTKEDVARVNQFLIDRNMLIILKPHPAQDLAAISELECSNIRVLYNEWMLKYGVQTNELLAQTDAMIGDYSGIYYDYLLLDKPIGITLDDYEEYRNQAGMVFKNPLDILVGRYIYNVEDLMGFLREVYEGEDLLLEQRKKIKELTNVKPYNESTRRVFNFIDEKYSSIWKEKL